MDKHSIYFLVPRKILRGRTEIKDGKLVIFIEYAETVDEWLKRCAVIKNVKIPDDKD